MILRSLPLVIAALIGFAAALPPYIAQERMGDAYTGIHPLIIDDQIFYLARTQETLDGYPTLGSTYIKERKGDPAVQFWAAEAVLATIAGIVGGTHAGTTLWLLVFPAAIFLVVYGILFVLTRERLFSLAGAMALSLGPGYLPFLRTPNLQLFVLLLGGFLSLLHFLDGKGKQWAIIAAAIGGLLFYVYPYYWMYWVIILGLAIPLCFLFARESRAHLPLLGVLSASIVIGIPYLLDTFLDTKTEGYLEAITRIGVLKTHFPSGLYIVNIVVVVSAILALCVYKKLVPRSPTTLLVLAAALGGAVLVNQHIVTGVNFFSTVHVKTMAEYFCAFAALLVLMSVLKTQKARLAGTTALVVLTLVLAAPNLIRLSTPQETDVAAQRYGRTLTWLAENAPRDAVVYANPAISLYVPAYTSLNTYFAPYAYISYMPVAELEQRFLASHYLDPSLTREDFIRYEADIFGLHFISRYQHTNQNNKLRTLLGMSRKEVDRYPEADIARLVEQGRQMRAGTFTDALGPYETDYIIWDSLKDSAWDMDRVQGAQKRYEADGLVVYELP